MIRLILLSLLTASPALAQRSRPVCVLEGITSSQDGTVVLSGVTVEVRDEQGQSVTKLESDGRGQFRITTLAPGRYTVIATMQGFDPAQTEVTLRLGVDEHVRLDLPVAQVAETVTVESQSRNIPEPAEFRHADAAFVETLPLREPTLEEFLPTLPGVIRTQYGPAIKGGTPLQSSLQVGSINVTEPATNASLYALPAAGLETLEVLPNPYSTEFGRFSSGVVLIEPRRGGDAWRFTTSNLLPGFKKDRGSLRIIGFSNVAPSVMIGGPLKANKLFLAQSLLFRYTSQEVRSRDVSERRKRESFNSFTRLDANLGKHLLYVSGSVYPDKRTFANLDTFTPPASTYNVHQQLFDAVVTDRVPVRPTLVLESTLHTSYHNVRVEGQEPGIMILAPSGVDGRYFNTQERRSKALQLIEVLSWYRQGPAGSHLFKFGADLFYSRFDGESISLPIEVRRADGTLARRIVFGPAAPLTSRATDISLFAQDRWQPTSRLLIDGGLRLDRDGVTSRWGITTRAGVTYALREDGGVLIGGGAGLFFERVPSMAAAYDELEPRLETWYDAAGTTPLGPSTLYQAVRAPTIKPPHGLAWNVQYEHRLSRDLALRVNFLQRRQEYDMTVTPISGSAVVAPATAASILHLDPSQLPAGQIATGALLLETNGKSSYREIEINPKYQRGDTFEINASYTLTRGRADLNSYALLYAIYREPIIQPNEHGPTATDVPNRFTARMRWSPRPRWAIVPMIDYRQGLRWTAVDEEQRVVGTRNEHRFPSAFILDIGVERRIRIMKWRPWVGVRAANLFRADAALDVQNNTGSPLFGQYFNVARKGFRIILRFQR